MRWRRLGRRLKKFLLERVSLTLTPQTSEGIWGIRLPRFVFHVILLCLFGYIFSITYLYSSYLDRFHTAQATIVELQQLKAENLTLKTGLVKVAKETETMRRVVSKLAEKNQIAGVLPATALTSSTGAQITNLADSVQGPLKANDPAGSAGKTSTLTKGNAATTTPTKAAATPTKATPTKATPAKTPAGKANKKTTQGTSVNSKVGTTPPKKTTTKSAPAKSSTPSSKQTTPPKRSTVSQNQVPDMARGDWSFAYKPVDFKEANDIVMFNYRVLLASGPASEGGKVDSINSNGFELLGMIEEDLFMLNVMIPINAALIKELGTDAEEYLALKNSTPTAWPLKDRGQGQGYISSEFGFRKEPMTGERVFHEGLDIGTMYGTPVTTSADGRVVFAGWDAEYGRLIIIDHGYGYQTRYGHLSKLEVGEGDRIKRGMVIAYSGNSGKSTGPHLHYEVRVNGIPRNPLEYYFKK